MRLNQFVARTSQLSRRAADGAIERGEVSVNGQVGVLGQAVGPADTVTLGGKALKLPETTTIIMLNKPVGYVCSRQRQGGSETIYALLPANLSNLAYVGRLDRGSSGLLLLSDDGDLVNRLSHPSFGKVKRYAVRIDRPLAAADAERLERGIDLGGRSAKMRITGRRGRDLALELTTGLNRQIRKSLEAVGYEVQTLKRTGFGPLELGELRPGHWRALSSTELTWLG